MTALYLAKKKGRQDVVRILEEVTIPKPILHSVIVKKFELEFRSFISLSKLAWCK